MLLLLLLLSKLLLLLLQPSPIKYSRPLLLPAMTSPNHHRHLHHSPGRNIIWSVRDNGPNASRRHLFVWNVDWWILLLLLLLLYAMTSCDIFSHRNNTAVCRN
jgi:hypothetical protein